MRGAIARVLVVVSLVAVVAPTRPTLATALTRPCTGTWDLIEPPDASGAFNGVSVRDDGSMWAVGGSKDGDPFYTTTPLLFERRQGTWTRTDLAGKGSLLDVIVDGDEAIAVGNAKHAEGYGGVALRIAPSGAVTSFEVPGGGLRAVDSIGGVAWAVGQLSGTTLVIRADEQGWVRIPSPNVGIYSNSLFGVTAVAPDDVWAVGWFHRPTEKDSDRTRTLAMHWDGRAWTVTPTPNLHASSDGLVAVDAVSTNDVWAVGDAIQHWDGTSWSIVGQSRAELHDVAAVSSREQWVVGGVQYERPVAYVAQGSSWQPVPLPADVDLYLYAVDAAPDGTIWAVGGEPGLEPRPPLVARLCPITVGDRGIQPRHPVLPRHRSPVVWCVDEGAERPHRLRDATFGGFDSGRIAPGGVFTHTFEHAGTYVVEHTASSQRSTVAVPVIVEPSSGDAADTYRVAWAAAPPDDGFLFDVQYRRPGGARFRDWLLGTTAPAARFFPDAGPGTYAFRARVRRPSDGATTLWSPAAPATVIAT